MIFGKADYHFDWGQTGFRMRGMPERISSMRAVLSEETARASWARMWALGVARIASAKAAVKCRKAEGGIEGNGSGKAAALAELVGLTESERKGVRFGSRIAVRSDLLVDTALAHPHSPCSRSPISRGGAISIGLRPTRQRR
jgi:hypothetical protein